MKRKIKTQHITLRVNVALVKALKRRARREGVTMTDLIVGVLATESLRPGGRALSWSVPSPPFQPAAPRGGAK